MKNTARWQLTSSMLHGFMGAVQTAYGYTQDLNESLNSIRIVTQKSVEDMDKFAERANRAAKDLSTTTTRYTDASLIYYQQGLTDEEVEARTNVTIKLANAAGESAETASEQLTAVWNNFAEGAENLEYYADVMTALGASTASSTQEISEGLQKFSAVADTVGLSYEYAAAALATVTATTRESAATVGTAFRTIFGRLESLKLGETLDDDVTLNKYSQALEAVGVNIMDASGDLKDMDQILDETMDKWQTLTRDQQIALAQTVAGVRQYAQFIALMDQSDFFRRNVATARGSEGALQEQADIYAESWEAARDRVRAAAEDIYDSLINDDFFIDVDKTLTPVLSGISDIIDGLGGMGGVASLAATAFMTLYGPKIAQGLRDTATNIRIITGLEGERARITQAAFVKELEQLELESREDVALNTKLQTLKEQVVIQGIINENEGKYSTEQLEQIKGEQAILKLLQEQAQSAADLAAQRKTNYEELTGGSREYLKQGGLDALRDNAKNFKTGNKLLQGITGFDTNTKALNKILDNSRTTGQAYNSLIRQLEIAKDRVLEFQRVQKQVSTDGETDWLSIAKSLGITAKNADVARDKVRELLEQGRDNVLYRNVDQVKNALKALSSDPKIIDEISRLYDAQIAAGNSAEQAMEAVRKKAEEVKQQALQTGEAQRDWASSIVEVGQSLSRLSMIANGVQSLQRTIADDTLTTTEKLTQMSSSIVAISMNAGPAISALKNLTTSVESFGLTAGIAKLALGDIVMIAGLIAMIAIPVIDKLIVTTKEAREDASKLANEYQEQVDALKNLQDELDSTQEKIKALQSDGITLIENEEYQRLKGAEASLERQLKIQERLNRLEAERSLSEGVKNAEKVFSLDGVRLDPKSLAQSLFVGDESDSWINDLMADLVNNGEFNQNNLDELKAFKDYRLKAGQTDIFTEDFLAEIQNTYNEALYVEQQKIYEESLAAYSVYLEDYDNLTNVAKKNADKILAISTDTLEQLRETNKELFTQDYIQPIAKSFDVTSWFKTGIFSEEAAKAIRTQGMTLEFFGESLDSVRDKLSSFASDNEISDFLRGLNQEELNVLLSLNTQGISSWDVFIDQFYDMVAEKHTISVDFSLARSTAYDALEKIRTGEFLEDEDIQALKEKFQGIFDLGNIEDLPLNDQLSVISAALETTFNPETLRETIFSERENLESLEKEAKKLANTLNVWGLSDADRTKYNNDLAKTRSEIAKTEKEIGSLEKQLDELFSNPYTLEIDLDEKVVNQIAAEMGIIRKTVSLIGEDFQVEAENIADLAKTMPEIFKNATPVINEAGQQVLQLNKETIDAISEGYRQTTEANRQAQLDRLTGELNVASNTLSILEALAKDEEAIGDNVTVEYLKDLSNREGSTDESVKEIVRLRLIQKIRENAASEDTTSQHEADVQNRVTASAVADRRMVENSEEANTKMAQSYYATLNQMARMKADFLSGNDITKVNENAIKSYQPNLNTSINYVPTKAKAARDTTAEENAINAIFSSNGNVSEAAKILGISIGETRDIIQQAFELAGVNQKYFGNDSKNLDVSSTFQSILTKSDLFKGMTREEREALLGLGQEEVGNLASLMAKLLEDGSFDLFSNGKRSDSSGKTITPKTLTEFKEHFYEINQLLEEQERLLKDNQTAIDRSYGTQRIDLYAERIKLLNEQLDLQRRKQEEASNGLARETNALTAQAKKLGILTPDISDGRINNYTPLMIEATRYLNRAEEHYNAGREELYNSMKAEYDLFVEIIKQFQTAATELEKAREEAADTAREIRDTELSDLNYKLQVQLDIRDLKRQINDFSRTIAESYGDALTHTSRVFDLNTADANAELGMLDEYFKKYQEYKTLMDNADEFTNIDEIRSSMEDLTSKIIESGENLLDWIDYWENMIPDAVSAAADRFQQFTDQLQHNTTVLDTIKELYALQGQSYRTQAGFNRLQRVSQERMDAAVATSQLQRKWYDRARQELAEAQAALDRANDGDYNYDFLKSQRDAYLEEFNKAQEAYLSAAQEALETAKDMFVEQIERASYEFGQKMVEGIKTANLDTLQEQYDHFISVEEEYFDDVNRAYQQATWFNRINADIANSTNKAYQERLAAFRDQLVAQRTSTDLDQYDLDIIEARYKLLQAEAALEDAQNSKTNLQLVRDNQGNWNYRYTADSNAIAEASKNVLDAQNEWYNIAKKRTKDVTGDIIANWKACQDAIAALAEQQWENEEDYQRAVDEIQSYYTERNRYLMNERAQAMADMTEAGSESITRFSNTYAEQLAAMTTNNNDFDTALADTLTNCKTNYNDFHDTVKDVADKTGVELDELDDNIKDVGKSTDDLARKGEECATRLWNQISKIDSVADSYDNLAKKISNAITQMETLARKQSSDIVSSYDNKTTETTTTAKRPTSVTYDASVNYANELKEVYEDAVHYTRGRMTAEEIFNLAEYQELEAKRAAKIEGEGLYGEVPDNKTLRELIKKGSFDTGGYTGTFSDAKLAFLHEKELVLNQEDTANILAATAAVRDITRMIDGNTQAALGAMVMRLGSVIAPAASPVSSTIDQNVHIEANFPGVQSAIEIEQALRNLVANADQYAGERG